MRLSIIQMSPGADRATNIAEAGRLIDAAVAADRPDMVALPEVWNCLGGTRATKFAQSETLPADIADAVPGSAVHFLRTTARRHGIHLHGGSILERVGAEGGTDQHLFNTSLAIGPDGTLLARYRKIHLFDITTPDGTGYRESAMFSAGSDIVTYQANGLPIGCAICYDLRFAELFIALCGAGAEVIMLPSAFTLQTGKDHWEPLLRARAIETQSWLAAPATTGAHDDGHGNRRDTWGHAMIIDPWGQVVAQCSDGPGFVTARIEPGRAARIRRDMPVHAHRRLALPGRPA